MANTILALDIKPRLWLKTLMFMCWDKIRAHCFLFTLCGLFFLSAWAINLSIGREMGRTALPYLGMVFGFIVPIAFAASLILVFLYLLIIKRPQSPSKAMIDFYRPLLTNPQRYANACMVIGCMLLGFMAFGDLKPLIPVMNPFSWDERFMRLDRILHFGQDPWKLLAPFLGHPIPTQWMNYAYNMWFVIMFSFWISAAWSGKTHTQHKQSNGWERQFLVSFILTWIIGGIILATVFSSVGPAFYDLVQNHNNPYAAQMAGLNTIHETHNLWAINTQEMLREAYLNPKPGQLSGISAMPSIHNATSTLFMLAAYRIHKKFGHVMLGFLICIILGSVHLAWHYAVDAYLGIIIAVILWKISGTILRWQDKVLPPKTTT